MAEKQLSGKEDDRAYKDKLRGCVNDLRNKDISVVYEAAKYLLNELECTVGGREIGLGHKPIREAIADVGKKVDTATDTLLKLTSFVSSLERMRDEKVLEAAVKGSEEGKEIVQREKVRVEEGVSLFMNTAEVDELQESLRKILNL